VIEFRILGPLEVLSDGHAVELGGPKQRALLALLLLEANRVVSIDRLIDALWGEEPPETAGKALQVYVSQLRKLLGKERLVTRAPGYMLRAEAHELDLARFQLLRGAGSLREALALWRGPPLGDLAQQPFAQAEIARLEELRQTCLEERIEADLAAGRHAEVAGELEALVAQQPLRERLRELHLVSLYRSGRQAEALAAYKEARAGFVDTLGIEPGKSLRDLQQAILRQDSSLDLRPESTEAAEATDTSRGVFVGRESELEELRGALDAAFAGRGRLFLLVGEPGIGKSRLAEELARHARERGATTLIGRCWEAGGAPAFWPWLQSLRIYMQQCDTRVIRSQLAGGAAEVAQIVPELRELFPDLVEPSREGEGARFRLFDAATRFLKNAAAARPILLVLDDLHAADEPSLLLLQFLAGELGASRMLVVGTYRDVDPTVRDPLAATLAELAREHVTRRVALGGLTEDDVARYLELTAGNVPAQDLVATIHTETEGNPLFVGEVVRLLASEGSLPEIDIQTLWTLGVPQGVREVIGRRLRRLSRDCSRLLTLASVLGREFRLEALERLSELGGDELVDLLDEAMSARVLASVPGTRTHLRFAHALIRETLYDELTTPRRVQLHRRAGEALEDLYGQEPEPHLAELAHHFFEAAPGGDVGKALDYARRAGNSALAQLAYEEAARLYGLALQAIELSQSADPIARCELLLALGDALWKAGRTPEAKEIFLSAADLARTAGLREHLARAALGYGGRFPWLRAGNDTRLVPLLEEALAALSGEESVLRVRLLGRLAGALRDQPSLEPRSSLSREAVEIARKLGDPVTLGYVLIAFAAATWGPETEEIAAIADEVTQLAAETSDPELAILVQWVHFFHWATAGDYERVARVEAEYGAIADELKQPSQQWYAAVMRTDSALFRGEFAKAEQLMGEVLRLGRAQQWDAGFAYRIALFALRREQGRLDEIEALITETAEEYAGYRAFRCLVPLLSLELGRPEDARPAFDELAIDEFATLPQDCEWLFCLAILAEVAAGLNDGRRAHTLYELLRPHARRNAIAAGELAVGSVARYLGLLAATLGQLDDAARHFEDAIAMNESMGARPWLAHTQHDYARMLLTRNTHSDREKAHQLLADALTTYEELGMHSPAMRASKLAEALAVDPRGVAVGTRGTGETTR
jgi:DNA-binding SARP family transcriptional activator/tetratricopeptide (TPR) repeat protein